MSSLKCECYCDFDGEFNSSLATGAVTRYPLTRRCFLEGEGDGLKRTGDTGHLCPKSDAWCSQVVCEIAYCIFVLRHAYLSLKGCVSTASELSIAHFSSHQPLREL